MKLAALILATIAATVPAYGWDAKMETEARKQALHDLQACLANPKIDAPDPPLRKIDVCKTVMGVDENGDDLPCQEKANGGCEAQ